ncbi:MAG TPA: carboxypeptidase regulatory-like domain-containing protein [Candidatus Acidoferrales bacterium]|nr:carboxypeptidase regulatory-like domain-containing protein [Candidatus Acidoferrales bacterium]
MIFQHFFKRFALALFVLAFLTFSFAGRSAAQTTISTGSISGVVTDPTVAAVPNAQVTITNQGTGQTIQVRTTGTGNYNSGALNPGTYTVKVTASGFKSSQTTVVVQVGQTASGNIKLSVGAATTTVEVTAGQVAVDTVQPTVQGVLTATQIQNLPINGRNFLDLAQLEPGVQIQDGSNFDPTKVGFSSISFGGRFGRTARIEVDGVDVSDETVGTTTEDIPALAISEFQTEQSTLDPSTELTSSGAVNVVTKSGTNAFHGDADWLFRDSRLAAALPAPPLFPTTFQRNYEDGDLGGPILKNRLFFYASGEYILQHENAGVPVASPFTAFSGAAPLPFREGDSTDRLDWSGPHGIHMFYRFSYFKNLVDSAFGAVSYQIYKNEDITRQHVVGADFNTSSFSHSFRFAYLKFQNNIGDAVRGTNLPFANFPVSLQVSNTLFTGPNLLAPQETPQSDHQFKYDGSWIHGSHLIRYGVDLDHIQGGGYAKFFGIDPTVVAGLAPDDAAAAAANAGVAGGCGPNDPNPSGASDPQCYPIDTATVGNGQGFSTEKPAFGFPAGGLGPDNRLGLYIGDDWKVKPTVTLSMGLRYDRDTGRTDSDLNNPAFAQAVNAILPGYGNPVRQPNNNSGPQLGVAWDVLGHGTTVIRAGAGIYYENAVYNNVLFDRPGRLATGQFLNFPTAHLRRHVGLELPHQGTRDDQTERLRLQPVQLRELRSHSLTHERIVDRLCMRHQRDCASQWREFRLPVG